MEGATIEAHLDASTAPAVPPSIVVVPKPANEEESEDSSSSSEDDAEVLQDDVQAIGFMVDPTPSQNIIQQMNNPSEAVTKPKRVIIETQDLSSSDSSDDDVPQELEDIESDEEKPGAWSVPKSKNEIVTVPPPQPVAIVISEKDKLTRVGVVSHTVEDVVVIQADMNSMALDIDSLLAFEDRTPIGKVEEVFGPVPQPFYTIRIIPGSDIARFTKGTVACAVESHTSFVLPAQIYVKGSDASNEYDEEIPPEMQEFSDDEEELKAKQMRKQNRKGRQAPSTTQGTHEYEPLARPDVMAAYASQMSTGNQQQPYSHPQKKQKQQQQQIPQPSYPHPQQPQQYMVPQPPYQHPSTNFTQQGYGYPQPQMYPQYSQPQYSQPMYPPQPMYSQPMYPPQPAYAQPQNAFDLFSAPPLITAPSYLPTDYNTSNPMGMLGRGKGFRMLSHSQELQQQQQQQPSNPQQQQYPSSGTSNATPITLADLEQLKVVDLRNELKRRGLDTSGLRTQLVARLKENWNVQPNQ